jgi:hydroxypyruvate isomerase
VKGLPGRCFDKKRIKDYEEIFKENLLLAAETLTPLGIKAVFEAINTYDMPDFIVHNGKQMLAILDQLKHPNLYMQIDVYHLHRMGEYVIEFIAQHVDKIGHIQFADSPGRGQPGTGDIDFQQLFSAIQQSGYSGWCGAEYKPIGGTFESLSWFKRFKVSPI